MDVTDLSNWIVLAVDDEPDSLEVLVEVLAMHNASIHAVSSGPEVLEKLSTVRPNLIITDLSMPGMDGYQLLYRIRHTEGFETLPVIALTAHAMAGDRERILAAGFTGYVSKPLRIASLASDILSMLVVREPAATKPENVSQPPPESTPAHPEAETPLPDAAPPAAVSVSPESTPAHPEAEPPRRDAVPPAAPAVSQPSLVPIPVPSDNGSHPSPKPPAA